MTATSSARTATTRASICDHFKSALSERKATDAYVFAREIHARLPEGEFAERKQASWSGLALSLLEFFRGRMGEQNKVRVFNPSFDEHG